MFLYSVYDKVAGVYTVPTGFKNNNVAKRAFVDFLDLPQNVNHKRDYSFYCLGRFDTETSEMIPLRDAVLIADGEDYAKN